MNTSNLRERVAKAMVAKDSGPEGSLLFKLHWQEFAEGYLTSADAAIAIVLEEAAKVADGYHRTKEVTRDLMDDGNITTTTVRSLADPLKIAAAIRALKEKNNG